MSTEWIPTWESQGKFFITADLNTRVRVKLRVKGIKQWRKNCLELRLNPDRFPMYVDDDGYAEFTFWDFINIFGPVMDMTADAPMYTDIKILMEPL